MNHEFESVVDGLADTGYAIVDQFLSQSEVADILDTEAFKNGIDHFKKAGIGLASQRQINEGIRSDYIRWVDKQTAPAALQRYLKKMHDLMEYINQNLFLSLKDLEIHMTIYPPGSYYKRHLDQHKQDDHRKLTVICYLNQDWKEEYGGQLRMYLPDETKDVLPLAGRLVCFRSDLIEHEVLPAIKNRYSLTGWVLDQLADLRHL